MPEENSKLFESAYSAAHYDKEYAIVLYDQEIKNSPNNWAAWNNRGVCKIQVGIDKKSEMIIMDGRNDVQRAINIATADNIDYPIAQANNKWAGEELAKLR